MKDIFSYVRKDSRTYLHGCGCFFLIVLCPSNSSPDSPVPVSCLGRRLQGWGYRHVLGICLAITHPGLWPVVVPASRGLCHVCFYFPCCRGPTPVPSPGCSTELRRKTQWPGASRARFSSWVAFWPPVLCSEDWSCGCKCVCACSPLWRTLISCKSGCFKVLSWEGRGSIYSWCSSFEYVRCTAVPRGLCWAENLFAAVRIGDGFGYLTAQLE